MINFKQFRELIVKPTLSFLDEVIPYSEEAVDLLLMTVAHESVGGTYLKQVKGPALGVYQIEPATHEDVYKNYLDYRSVMKSYIQDLQVVASVGDEEGRTFFDEDLIFNLVYATAVARVIYWRAPEPLPEKYKGDYWMDLAKYAKKYYNTSAGKATAEKYYEDYVEWSKV